MSATSLSYSHDLSREEIIARYRERIAQNKRSKLTKAELELLIGYFIANLIALEQESTIQLLCAAEIALLEEGYAQSTVAFDYLPKYRQAITRAIADGSVSLSPANSHRFLHFQRVTGLEEERFEHYALTYLKYDEATYQALDSRSQLTNLHRQVNLKGVNPWLYLHRLQELLHSQHRFAARHLAIALAGLTGRRIGEVIARGRFSLSGHPYLLLFEGHSKVERAAYEIVCLIPATELLPFLERFRSLPEISPLLSLKGEDLTGAINQFDVQVNRECKKFLGNIVPPLEGREGISVHNLRSLWGAIACYFFCPPSAHEYPFLQHFLGHVLDSPATGHYFRYRLVDGDGRFLENRGIMIAEYGELPLPQLQTNVIAEAALQEQHLLDLLPALLEDEPLASSLGEALASMLSSDRYTVLLTALMAVTGRSPGELLKSATFEPFAEEMFAVSFSPTGLGHTSRLVTLVSAAAVVAAVARLRLHCDVQSLLYQSPSSIDSHCQLFVTRAISQYLPFDGLEGMFANYSRFTQAPVTPLLRANSQPVSVIYHIYSDDKQRLGAIASQLSLEGSQPQVFASLLDWVESRLSTSLSLQSEATVSLFPDSVASTIHAQASTLAWLTQEVGSLRGQVSELQAERDALKSQLEQASLATPQLALLQADNQRLTAELSQAKAKLDGFRLLLLGEEGPVSEPILDAVSPEREVLQSSCAEASSLVFQPQPRRGGRAKERAMRIFEALQQWNQLHPDYTFALNPGLLEVTFRVHRQAAKDFISEHQGLIDQYHTSIGVVNPYSHNRSKDLSLLQAFFLSQETG